jgi:hypothetical protein
MAGIIIRKGSFEYSVGLQEHRNNIQRLKQIPNALKEIRGLSRRFIGKPQFIIQQKDNFIRVIRQDYQKILGSLIALPEDCYSQQLSQSEWRTDAVCRGIEPKRLPLTLHDVYTQEGVTIKTGNPYCNNAWEEFYRALHARCLGIVEAKSPIGFSFWLDDPYGMEKPGKMFYKHLGGKDLGMVSGKGDKSLLNWALWEAGKFFSRLINAHLYLEDSDRLGNYFIEEYPSTKVFRFLDLERMYFIPAYSHKSMAEMLSKFIKKSLEEGLLTSERLGEFLIVCLGAHSPAISLVK